MSIEEAIDQYLMYQYHRKGRTESTIGTYRSVLNSFVAYTGSIPLGDLRVSTVDSYADYLLQFNFAQKTYRNKLTPVRSLVRYLYGKNLCDIRPESIDLPSTEETEANFLTREEQVAMVNACKNKRERALILTLIRSGVRVSELVNLRTADLYERSLIVRRGKGKKHRITFVAEDAELAIEEYHRSLDFEPAWIVCGQSGLQLTRQYVHRLVVAIAERADIKKEVSPHTLRHTFATNLLMDGARIEDVQKMMGHVNIRNTLIYMHFTNEYLKSKYDKSITKMLV